MREIAEFLREHSALWQFPSFSVMDFPWRESHPELCRWLDGVEDDKVVGLRRNRGELVKAMRSWVELPDFEPGRLEVNREFSEGERFFRGIGGRKASQVEAFCERVGDHGLPYLEWCSGKGHLSRALDGAATCLEIDPALCATGEARVGDREIQFVCADALGDEATTLVTSEMHALALHACGALHVRLIRLVAAAQTKAVTVSPCCYHKMSAPVYDALSQSGQRSGLNLKREDLRTAVQESVVANEASRRRRVRELRYRLGFDLMQREIRAVDEYLHVPSASTSVMEGGFESFCRWASGKRGVDVGVLGDLDWGQWERFGAERVETLEKIEMVRDLFRRGIEMWLVRDRAALLEESGYEVEVGTFCDKSVTPRNLMIRAVC